MDVRPKASVVVAKTLVLLFLFIIVGIFLIKPPLTSSIARAQGERVFENTIPKDVPIRLKIKKEKEKSFKALKNENWVREFELELTNTGDKPIYFLFLDLITDVKLGGDPLVFSLVYGRAELGDIISKARPDDPPIKPGETYVFKIHPGQVPAWEQSVRTSTHPEASRIRAKIEMLSFGDGTGYFGDHPYPPIDRRQSTLNDRTQRPNNGRLKALAGLGGRRGKWPRPSSSFDTPATMGPANFLASGSSKELSLTAAPPLDGCLFEECIGIIPSALYLFAITARSKTGPHFIQPVFAGSSSTVRGSVSWEVKCIIVKQSPSMTAALARDPLHRPPQRQLPRCVLAPTQMQLAPQTAPTRLTRPAASTRFKDLGAVTQ